MIILVSLVRSDRSDCKLRAERDGRGNDQRRLGERAKVEFSMKAYRQDGGGDDSLHFVLQFRVLQVELIDSTALKYIVRKQPIRDKVGRLHCKSEERRHLINLRRRVSGQIPLNRLT